jgi:hypothetical protein
MLRSSGGCTQRKPALGCRCRYLAPWLNYIMFYMFGRLEEAPIATQSLVTISPSPKPWSYRTYVPGVVDETPESPDRNLTVVRGIPVLEPLVVGCAPFSSPAFWAAGWSYSSLVPPSGVGRSTDLTPAPGAV